MNKLIDLNICDQLVDKQLRKDEQAFTEVSLRQKINAILCKDTSKSDLAQSHHGALFSPVTSTMSEVIKTIIL